ncbi:hypothetical protein P8605_27725 [Streptomyces sp. T-3]|nr:hypothetical protein [Streptomyces sp. T-3]
MGFTTAWAITAHDDAFIAQLAPRMLPLLDADRSDPLAQERWRRWQARPLPDYRTWWGPFGHGNDQDAEDIASFRDLTSPGNRTDEMYDGGPGDTEFYLPDDVWQQAADTDRMFLSIHSKEYAVASLFHAIGPRRAALLPGWCGNFLLDSAQLHQALPTVEQALTFTPEERAAAEDQDWLDYYGPTEESVLDGPLRQLREAAATGLGVCGVSVHIH